MVTSTFWLVPSVLPFAGVIMELTPISSEKGSFSISNEKIHDLEAIELGKRI